MAGIVQFPAVGIKSVQAFDITMTLDVIQATATITSVNTARSFLLWHGDYSTSNGDVDGRYHGAPVLTNGTTVTVNRLNNTLNGTAHYRGMVVEMNS